ncbi:MAG: hypothetical protein RLZ98_2945 [Pseudomonadota bacterium]
MLEWQRSDVLLSRDGIWRSRGYGWIWEVKRGRVQAYDVTANTCVRNGSPDDLPGDLMERIQIDNGRNVVRLSIDDPNYLYTFDRVDRLPEACRQPTAKGPRDVFQSAVETLSAHYAFFDVRGVDWVRHVRSVRPKVHDAMTNRQLFATLSDLIAPINDAHVNIAAEFDNDEFYFRPRRPRKPVTEADRIRALRTTGYWTKDVGPILLGKNAKSVGDGRIKYGLIGEDKDIGYLMVSSSGGTLRRALGKPLDDALTLFKDTKALIIDITRNYGGTDNAAREFTRRFLDKRILGYYRYAADERGEKPQAVYVEPSERVRYTKPVFLISSRTSISAAELIVLVLRGLPHVTHIGEPTRGSLSDVLGKKLPNGWRLNLSNEVYADRAGNAWEGKGVPPDVPVLISTSDEISARDVLAANKVLEFIRSRL